MNIRLILEYDGTEYHGWQIQKNGLTIQEIIKTAVKQITNESVTVIGCGRTDSGVHALNYICNFRTNSNIPPEKFKNAINAHIPKDICCKHSDRVDEEFHSSSSAVSKTYLYRILNKQDANVFERNYAWHYKYEIDLEKMKQGARAFLGEHDFIGFASAGFTVKTTVREIYALDIHEENGIISIEITGNGFLYNMVRIIAGTLVMMGNGKIDYKLAEEIIESKDRKRAGITAPAQGLFLKEVHYSERGREKSR